LTEYEIFDTYYCRVGFFFIADGPYNESEREAHVHMLMYVFFLFLFYKTERMILIKTQNWRASLHYDFS